ncbi:unnamed protein product [Prorocentrum cordatum]|uniref:Major facilitator superfamily associated domain-containing protein n=1 Tax=Prorocentrum cordatum TaxID=2364126 RepID=A0ABN9VR92_9DINO|nr:unnamed protein product [Polarella glacialis]|mmetsp:Transcript_41223/g.118113  ORF Transcript_41223/g.118113 Transcript_41223/m.118113 type:complete len:467 (-) Transcript_41223:111-1511(-)
MGSKVQQSRTVRSPGETDTSEESTDSEISFTVSSDEGKLSSEDVLLESSLSTRVPWRSVSAFFFFTSYNVVSKRYFSLAASSRDSDDPLAQAAVFGFLVNMVILSGTVLFCRAVDCLDHHYLAMVCVLSMSTITAVVAWVCALTLPVADRRIQGLIFVAIFLSSGPQPLRDAIATKLVQYNSKICNGTSQSFGKQRLFMVLGQMVLALITSSLMHGFGPSNCLVAFAGCLACAMLVFGIRLKEVSEWYGQVKAVESTIIAKRPTQSDWCSRSGLGLVPLILSFLFIGMASGQIDYILFPYLYGLGMPLSVLGISHAIALAAEIPTYYLENELVEFIGSYEGTFIVSCATMCIRLGLLAMFVVDSSPTPLSVGFLIFTEMLHGLAGAPVRFVTARLANTVAPPHLQTTFQACFNLAVGHGGAAVSCVLLYFCSRVGVRAIFAASAVFSLVAAVPILMLQVMNKRLRQ